MTYIIGYLIEQIFDKWNLVENYSLLSLRIVYDAIYSASVNDSNSNSKVKELDISLTTVQDNQFKMLVGYIERYPANRHIVLKDEGLDSEHNILFGENKEKLYKLGRVVSYNHCTDKHGHKQVCLQLVSDADSRPNEEIMEKKLENNKI